MNLLEKKYPLDVEFIENKEYQRDGGVSVSLFQRSFRIGYSVAQLLMDKLIKNNLIEPFQEWVGWTENGVRTKGNEATFYRVVQLSWGAGRNAFVVPAHVRLVNRCWGTFIPEPGGIERSIYLPCPSEDIEGLLNI